MVEVDETYIGGVLEPGLSGGRARGKKVLTGIAAGHRVPAAPIAPTSDASAASLREFITSNVAPADGGNGPTPGTAIRASRR